MVIAMDEMNSEFEVNSECLLPGISRSVGKAAPLFQFSAEFKNKVQIPASALTYVSMA
jgi:hypothetical protein